MFSQAESHLYELERGDDLGRIASPSLSLGFQKPDLNTSLITDYRHSIDPTLRTPRLCLLWMLKVFQSGGNKRFI